MLGPRQKAEQAKSGADPHLFLSPETIESNRGPLLGKLGTTPSRLHSKLMKKFWCFILLVLSSGSLFAATPIQDIRAAIDKLRASPSYSWKTTTITTNVPQQPLSLLVPVPSQGRILADGTAQFTLKVLPLFAPPCEFVVRGPLGAVRNVSLRGTPAWASLADVERGDPAKVLGDLFGGATPVGLGLEHRDLLTRLTQAAANFKSPTYMASDLLSRMRQLKLAGAIYAGEIPPSEVIELIGSAGFFAGSESTLTSLKGAGTVWVTKGVLTKFEFSVSGIAPVQAKAGFTFKRSTEILDVGSTKIEVPREAF